MRSPEGNAHRWLYALGQHYEVAFRRGGGGRHRALVAPTPWSRHDLPAAEEVRKVVYKEMPPHVGYLMLSDEFGCRKRAPALRGKTGVVRPMIDTVAARIRLQGPVGVSAGSVGIRVHNRTVSSGAIGSPLDEPQQCLRNFPPHTLPRPRSHVVPRVRRPSHRQRACHPF